MVQGILRCLEDKVTGSDDVKDRGGRRAGRGNGSITLQSENNSNGNARTTVIFKGEIKRAQELCLRAMKIVVSVFSSPPIQLSSL